MKTDLFDYELPPSRIAGHPVTPRDSARMLDLTGLKRVDRTVRDLPEVLRPGDLLIGNDTRVIPARLDGLRDGVRIEVTLHRQVSETGWLGFARPGKRLKVGHRIDFAPGFRADVMEKRDGGEIGLRFNCGGVELIQALERHGRMPLPPYIRRERTASGDHVVDRHDYQTIYARHKGAVAAPTAGLHFTPRLLERIEERGIGFATVTLHVGAGTFLPVKVEDTDDHVMHTEWGTISEETAGRIVATRRAGGRIVAIGTTSLRVLESASTEPGAIAGWTGETDLFITPGYRFKVVDLLLTNFHLPRSTLFMLVCAVAGMEPVKEAYAHAIRQGYRFYSYGDACLLRVAGRDDGSVP